MNLYSLVKPLIFQLDAERAHTAVFEVLEAAKQCQSISKLLTSKLRVESDLLYKRLWGLNFPNPVGLAAGFDKNALLIDLWAQLGFGFLEVGTVTPKSQDGNPQPRLFRLTKDKALLNRMGFNNDGAEIIAERLSLRKTKIPIGGNIGKNKWTSNEEAFKDYVFCIHRLSDVVDFFTVNVSSPNTPGLRSLQNVEALKKILVPVFEANAGKSAKPILLKIAPDLSLQDLDDIMALCIELKLDGIIANNTTITRPLPHYSENEIAALGAGGVSGKPISESSQVFLEETLKRAGAQLPVIAVGGIMNPNDAVNRIKAGACLVQVYSGYVYEGPNLIPGINKALLASGYKAK